VPKFEDHGLGKREQDTFRQYLLQFTSECCMYSAIDLTLLLSFCVGVSLVSYIKRRKNRLMFVRAGCEGNICCEREIEIEGCRSLCSELPVCYCSPYIINKIVAGR